jgi:hypothetical protein
MKKHFRKIEISGIVFLIFALSIVWVIMGEMKKNLPRPGENMPALPNGQKIGFIDSVYYNFQDYFSITAPNDSWTMQVIVPDSGSASPSGDEIRLEDIYWLLLMERRISGRQVALAKVGIVKWEKPVDSDNAAISILDELLKSYEQNGRANILQPVTAPAHKIMQGHYFVLVFPQSPTLTLPVWVGSFLPRDKILYIILSQTTEEAYPEIREELEKIVSSFRPISYSINKKKCTFL